MAEPSTLVIIDPLTVGRQNIDALLDLRPEFSSLEIVAYSRLNPSLVPEIIRSGRYGVSEVVIYSHDDEVARFRAVAERVAASPLALRVLELLEPQLRSLQPQLRSTIEALYHSPLPLRSTCDLASSAQMTRSTLYRLLKDARFTSPRLLVASGRVVRATALLQDPGRSLRSIASRLGFSKPERLSGHVREVTGLSPSALRLIQDRDTVAGLIVSRLIL